MHLHLERKMSKFMLMNHPWAHQNLHSIIVFKTPNSAKLFNQVKQKHKIKYLCFCVPWICCRQWNHQFSAQEEWQALTTQNNSKNCSGLICRILYSKSKEKGSRPCQVIKFYSKVRHSTLTAPPPPFTWEHKQVLRTVRET